MKSSQENHNPIDKKNFWQIFNPASLKVRLTIGIAIASAFGIGGLAIWTSVRMQQILVSTHKESIKYIAARFPMDVEIYSEMVSLPEGAQKAIDNLSTDNILLWVKSPSGEITSLAAPLEQKELGAILLPLNNVPPIPQVEDLNGSYWLMCATPLRVQNTNLGKLYIAQDITDDQIMFLSLIRSLGLLL